MSTYADRLNELDNVYVINHWLSNEMEDFYM